MKNDPLLIADDLTVRFPVKGGVLHRTVAQVHAVEKVNLKIYPGEIFGLVGESGCGKSTLGRTLIRLHKPTSGRITFQGYELSQVSPKKMRRIRKNLQIILQDPYESLNPRHSVQQIIEEPFRIHATYSSAERKKKVEYLLEMVGLQKQCLDRYPHEFSGGQRQRISIARAIALSPKLIVCDEAVSALDVSIQSQILNLLMDLQKKLDLAYLFIAHDLTVVRHISDRIGIMYLGKIVELATPKSIYEKPRHPYTRALIDAIPNPDPSVRKQKWTLLEGEVPSPISPPKGCCFQGRCPHVREKCRQEEPLLTSKISKNIKVACHFEEEISSSKRYK